MGSQRLGLWILTAGIFMVIGHFVALEVVRQLVATKVFHGYPMRFVVVVGYVNVGITCVLIGGSIIAAIGSEGTRRSWLIAAAILFGLDELMFLLAQWLEHAGGDASMRVVHWLTGIAVLAHVAALASITIVSRVGSGNKPLATVTLWILGARAALFLVVWIVPSTSGSAEPLPNVEMIALLLSWLASLAVLFDLLGAFSRIERTPAARARSESTLVASAISMALLVIGIALAALALWGTKRMASSTPNTATFVRGSLMFFAAALMLSRLQARTIHTGGFVAAFVATLIVGRLVLHGYERPAQEVELETHDVPGLSIQLPVGTTDIDYEHLDHGKLTISPRHADFGAIELSWDRWDHDPVDEYKSAATTTAPAVPISDRVGDTPVHGILVAMIDSTHVYESWQCPGDDRWFLLAISRYERDEATISKVSARIISTLRCHPR